MTSIKLKNLEISWLTKNFEKLNVVDTSFSSICKFNLNTARQFAGGCIYMAMNYLWFVNEYFQRASRNYCPKPGCVYAIFQIKLWYSVCVDYILCRYKNVWLPVVWYNLVWNSLEQSLDLALAVPLVDSKFVVKSLPKFCIVGRW